MDDTTPIGVLTQLILRIREGDVSSFQASLSLLDEMSLIDVSREVDGYKLFALYAARCFIGDVLSNLSGDSMFEFPTRGSYWERQFCDLVAHIGDFMYEFVVAQDADQLAGIKHFSDAVSLYYKFLANISQIARTSDLRDFAQRARYENALSSKEES